MDWFNKIAWSLGWELLNLTIIVDDSPFRRLGHLFALTYHILGGVLESLAFREFRLRKSIKTWIEITLAW